jgi:hypothetical protein
MSKSPLLPHNTTRRDDGERRLDECLLYEDTLRKSTLHAVNAAL